jgi:uncharacterized small protein (TIGR04563 family)
MKRAPGERNPCAITVYVGDLADEILAEAARMDRTPSWVLQRAWRMAREEIGRMPAPERMDTKRTTDEARRMTMATKNDPGKFDYANAEPDEPMFVLLGRDKDAPALVRAWADQREDDGESAEKVAEARACAASMEAFWAARVERKAQGLAFKAFCNDYEVVAARTEDEARETLRTTCLGYEVEDLDGEGWTILPNEKELRSEEDPRSVETVGSFLAQRLAESGGKPVHLWSCAQ